MSDDSAHIKEEAVANVLRFTQSLKDGLLLSAMA